MNALRYTESAKWGDSWFRQLRPEFKLAWMYICDTADIAGIIDLDRGLADFVIGCDVDWELFLTECGDRLCKLNKGKFWVTKFVSFQQRTTVLSSKNKCHVGIINRLERAGIPFRDFGYGVNDDKKSQDPSKPLPRALEAPEKPLPRGYSNSNSNASPNGDGVCALDTLELLSSKETGAKNDKATSARTRFDKFWEVVHLKKGKGGAVKAFAKAEKKVAKERGISTPDAAGLIIRAMEEFASAPEARPTHRSPIHPSTWLTDERYDDDPETWYSTTSHARTNEPEI